MSVIEPKSYLASFAFIAAADDTLLFRDSGYIRSQARDHRSAAMGREILVKECYDSS